mmetsp:Transcript_6226/g.23469  ORF Transcript_6226/g.23469 Transcript_6226/m.23469 type:complete len:91 (-) Transcript_6226:875-1147(-)
MWWGLQERTQANRRFLAAWIGSACLMESPALCTIIIPASVAPFHTLIAFLTPSSLFCEPLVQFCSILSISNIPIPVAINAFEQKSINIQK